MKEKELRKLATCSGCGKKLGASFREHHSLPIFWKITGERFMLDDHALKAQAGIEMYLGGTPEAVALAQVMGPDEDLTKQVMEPVTICLCEHCALEERKVIGAILMEKAEKDGEAGGP